MEMRSYAFDVWVRDSAFLTDSEAIVSLFQVAAKAGGATVLGETSHTFPNGAVTAVLVLAQSHLSIHTWPEYNLVNIDLFTYGQVKAELILAELEARLAPVRRNLTCLVRAVPDALPE
jgi:S-adenosylmethionine decarboxylase